jgi:hypothetical protein
VDLISTLSPPEQWLGRRNIVRSHNNNTIATLTALSQMELADGSLSISGLDLTRREVLFEQEDLVSLNWRGLADAFQKMDNTLISTEALLGRKSNGAFFRDFLNDKIETDNAPEQPLRVFIVVSSSVLFERGSDLQPLRLDTDCRCRVYHLRFRHGINDVFDDLQRFIKPLRPRTFNVTTARDLRKAVAEIIAELEAL